jgi:hypothetical protein
VSTTGSGELSFWAQGGRADNRHRGEGRRGRLTIVELPEPSPQVSRDLLDHLRYRARLSDLRFVPYHDGLQVALACFFPCIIGLPPQGFWVR